MKHLFIALLVMVGLAARSFAASSSELIAAAKYGSESYADWRQITYWGRASLSVMDYDYGSGDSEFLKLISIVA